MELNKAEEEKMEIFLIDLNRKLDLFIEMQAALIKEVQLMLTAKKVKKEPS
jgi:hypothetical protein